MAGQPAQVDPAALDAQLAELKAEVTSGRHKPRSSGERNGREM